MKANFWRVLESIGSADSAAHDWKFRLGKEWEDCRRFLQQGTGVAQRVMDPDHSGCRHLIVDQDDDGKWIAFADDHPLRTPVVLSADDVGLLRPDWTAIADALATSLRFVSGPWETQGLTRQIGIARSSRNPALPVILHLPAGHLGDQGCLRRDLAGKNGAMVLVPSSSWLTPEIQSLRKSHQLAFIALAEHFEALEAGADEYPIAVALDTVAHGTRVTPVLYPQTHWTWDKISIVVASGGRLLFSCAGRQGEHRLPKTSAKKTNQATGIMMRLAVEKYWCNPPSDAKDHESVRKNFQRLEKLLRSLVPIPGDPFRRESGKYIPNFVINLHSDLLESFPGKSRSPLRRSSDSQCRSASSNAWR